MMKRKKDLLRDEINDLYIIEKGLYDYLKEGNEKMVSFLKEEEKRKLAKITREKAFFLMNQIAIDHHLEKEYFPNEVLLINGLEQDLPLKRLLFQLEQILCDKSQSFRDELNEKCSMSLSLYLSQNNYQAMGSYANKSFYLAQLDAMRRFIGKIKEENMEEEFSSLIEDIYYLYPPLLEDKKYLHNEDSGYLLGCSYEVEEQENEFKRENYEAISSNAICSEAIELVIMEKEERQTKEGKNKIFLGSLYIESYLLPNDAIAFRDIYEEFEQEWKDLEEDLEESCDKKRNKNTVDDIFASAYQKSLSFQNIHKGF